MRHLLGEAIAWIRRADLPALWRGRLIAGAERSSPVSSSGERWLLCWAGIGLIVGFAVFSIGGYHAGFQGLNALAAEYPSWVWSCLTVLGDERVAFALSLFFSMRYPRIFWSLILAALIAVAVSRGLKELFDAARPPAVLAADAFNLIGPAHRRASFPSGHSVTAGVFFGVLIHHARSNPWRALWLSLAVLVGFSRVAVGVHWPVDVLAGLTLGALAAWCGGRLAARWPAPAMHLGVHMAFVLLACVLAFGLMFDDGGYAQAASMQRLLGMAAVASALWHYTQARSWFGRWRG